MRINYKKIGAFLLIFSVILFVTITGIALILGAIYGFKCTAPRWLDMTVAISFALAFLSGLFFAYLHKDILINEFKKLY
jgi:hypothetical protein